MVSATPTVFCDPCIADLVRALNAGGFKTKASCCGHGRSVPTIILEGDVWLFVTTRAQAERISPLVSGDINAPLPVMPV